MSEKILKYPGSKGNIVSDLIQLLPVHKVYLEPYFGSGTLFFCKEPAAIETINDMDSDIVNLFKVIRDAPVSLANSLIATPYSREVYDNSYEYREDVPPRLVLKPIYQSVKKCMQSGIGMDFRSG